MYTTVEGVEENDDVNSKNSFTVRLESGDLRIICACFVLQSLDG